MRRQWCLPVEQEKDMKFEDPGALEDKNNIGSAKSIINNGGVLENEIVDDGVIEQRN